MLIKFGLLMATVLPWTGDDGATKADAKDKPTKSAKLPYQTGLPASLAGFEDAGKFALYQRETRLIGIDFRWTRDGKYEAQMKLSFAGQTLDFSTRIVPEADGVWKKIEAKTRTGFVEITRDGSAAVFKTETVEKRVDLPAKVVVFDNFGPALMSSIVRSLDASKAGKQNVPLLLLPGGIANVSVEKLEPVERTVAGKDIRFDRHLVALPGVEVTVWTANGSKVYLGEVPSQQAFYVREGYESLMKPADEAGPISKPEFEVNVQSNRKSPMRDGVELATDLYLPDRPGRYPVILIRTPYKKEIAEAEGRYFARRGYVVAIQDVRGRFSSPGEWDPFVNEAHDGYDAIEWLAGQEWSTGKVGMIGASYLGWVQWQALGQNPPHLACIIPNVSPPDPFFNFPYEHGVFFLWGAIWWAEVIERNATADISGSTMQELMSRNLAQQLSSLPVIELDKKVFGREIPYWRRWIEHNVNDEYWQRAAFADKLADARVPVFHQSGWFDGDGIGSKLNYAAMLRHGHPHQKLVLGPWGHTDTAVRSIGDLDFGPEALVDLQREYLRWFDCWLKGMNNGVPDEPLVRVFAMNSNKWHTGNRYPLEKTRFDKWHLSSDGGANTSKGNGRLSRSLATTGSEFDSYSYDPANPTPRPELPIAETTSRPDSESPRQQDGKASKSRSQSGPSRIPASRKERSEQMKRVAESRSDILVYVSEPFDADYTFAGPIEAVLYASSSAKDTDWFVRLVEVDQSGDLSTLVEGRMRARFRHSFSKPEPLEPGKIYEYRVDCWQTGVTMRKGSRLRVEIASASFPYFSRNLNTGGHNEKETEMFVAEQRIYHSAEFPSHIVLPALP